MKKKKDSDFWVGVCGMFIIMQFITFDVPENPLWMQALVAILTYFFGQCC